MDSILKAAMTTFNKVMNIPPLPTRRVFTKIQNERLLSVVKQLATDRMINNAFGIKADNANDDGDCKVSINGTWQKRGYASRNGVVTVILLDCKKCLDVEILSDKFQKWGQWTNDAKQNA